MSTTNNPRNHTGNVLFNEHLKGFPTGGHDLHSLTLPQGIFKKKGVKREIMIIPSINLSLTGPVFPFVKLTFYAGTFALPGAYRVHAGCGASSQSKRVCILAAKDHASPLPTS